VPLFRGELCPHLTQYGLDRGLHSYQAELITNTHNRHGPKTRGLCALLGGAGSPSTQCHLGSRPTFVPSGILIRPAVWPQQTWVKIESGGCAPSRRRAGSPSNNVAWVEAYLRTKWHLDPSIGLATRVMGQKLGHLCPFGGRWVPI